MRRARLFARIASEILVTSGVVVALFGVYELSWSNVEATAAQRELTGEMRRSWGSDAPSDGVGDGGGDGPSGKLSGTGRPPASGEGLALLHIPRLGEGWVRPVVQGVAAADLARGVGHYAETALPGEVGNFAVAGHRATRGEPLRHLDRLRTGDAVVVETRDAWFTYAVRVDPVVVASTATGVIAPVPDSVAPVPDASRSGEAPAEQVERGEPGERLLTLTTCHPRWSSEQRMIVHASLVEERPHAAGSPPALAGARPGTTPGGA